MIAYEFYAHDGKGKWDSIGILLERRNDPLRINQESVMRWGRMFFAHVNLDVEDICFIPIEIFGLRKMGEFESRGNCGSTFNETPRASS